MSFLTRKQLADQMNVSPRQISYWMAEGMPAERWGEQLRRFELERCVEWVRNREDNGNSKVVQLNR